MSLHQTTVVPMLHPFHGYYSRCPCGYLSPCLKGVLEAHQVGVIHRKAEQRISEIIEEMNRKGFLIALEDININDFHP